MWARRRGLEHPRLRLRAPGIVLHCLAMVVTQLNLEFCFRGKKLRGFSCELTRSPRGVLPESFFTIMCQVVVPILLSGLCMMAAGLVMNTVQVRTGCLGDRGGRHTDRVSWHHRQGRLDS